MNFDKTYCTGDGCKHFGPCHRSLTHKVMQEARRVDARVSRFEFPENFHAGSQILKQKKMKTKAEELEEALKFLLESCDEIEVEAHLTKVKIMKQSVYNVGVMKKGRYDYEYQFIDDISEVAKKLNQEIFNMEYDELKSGLFSEEVTGLMKYILPIKIENLPHITKTYKAVPTELQIKFKRIHPKAQIPKKQHKQDAGYDLTAVSVSYGVNRQVIYGTGLCVQIPEGYVGLIYPRSSIRKLSLTLSNSVGIIDAGYTGEIQVTFRQHDLSEIYNSGDRVAQLVIEKLVPVEFIEVEELDETERGAGGHGSTGK